MSKLIKNLLALAIVALAGSAQAEWKWEHFGVAPYAATRQAALETRESAIRSLGYPEPVVALLTEATKKPGEKTEMKNGNTFVAQVSKGGVVYGLKEGGGIVAFATPTRGMRYVADGEKWTINWEGEVYSLILPEVCYNFTRGYETKVPPPPKLLAPAASAPFGAAREFSPGAEGVCPTGYTLIVHLWDLSKIKNPATFSQATALIMAAERRESDFARRRGAYTPDNQAFSRTLGRTLRGTESHAAADMKMNVRVRLLRDATSMEPLAELDPINLVAGEGSITLSAAQHEKIVETVWEPAVVSPTESGGLHRLRLFLPEWTDCRMHIHGAVRAVAK